MEESFLSDIPVRDSIAIDRPMKRARHGDDFTTPLNLQVEQDILRIPEIEKRPLPREDGRPWEFWQQTESEETRRPYGKAYLKDQLERHQILSSDPSYRFLCTLAGALRKEPFELFEEEDVQRVISERETERLRIELDLKRTRLNVQEKHDMIEKMQRMLGSLIKEQQERERQLPPTTLLFLSRFIVDATELPATITSNRYYGFQNLVREARLFAPDSIAIQRLIDETIDSADDRALIQQHGTLFYHLYMYFQYFLDNDTADDLQEALRVKLRYIIDSMPSLLDQRATQPRVDSSSTTTTTTTTTSRIDTYYEEKLGEMSRELAIFNPWHESTLFFKKAESSSSITTIDWTLYKNTETLNMQFYEKLQIPLNLERQMAALGLESTYITQHREYGRNMLRILYGTMEERDLAQRGANGVNLVSDDVHDGGHPAAIAALIRRQFADFKTSKPLAAIAQLVRSHFLWLFFNNTPWVDIVALLLPHNVDLVRSISDVFTRWSAILDAAITLYKPLLMTYLRRVADYLVKARADNGRSVLTLPVDAEQLLMALPVDTPLILEREVSTFDALNRSLRTLRERDLLGDELFYRYVTSSGGEDENGVFKTRFATLDHYVPRQPSTTTTLPRVQERINALVEVMDAYPALRLHLLFRLYASYLSAYNAFVTENLDELRVAIVKARSALAKMVGDESVAPDVRVDRGDGDYRQRRSFTTQPINSGFVILKAEIKTLISRAYQKVQEYVPSLRGLPLEGFHSESAYESGLASAMVEYIAIVAADNELIYPDQYKSQHQHHLIRQKLHETMAPLRRFTYHVQESWSSEGVKKHYGITRTFKRVASEAFQLPYLMHGNGASPTFLTY